MKKIRAGMASHCGASWSCGRGGSCKHTETGFDGKKFQQLVSSPGCRIQVATGIRLEARKVSPGSGLAHLIDPNWLML